MIDHTVADYSAPLDEPLVHRLVHRFRLEKTDPTAARSPVKKPIVFYIDRAAPEPVRSALMDGARWWAQAFEAAGFIDAFRVEVLPEGVDRDAVVSGLKGAGIHPSVHFRPLHHFSWFIEHVDVGPSGLEVCDAMANRALSLPLHTGLSEADVDRVCVELLQLIAA